MDHLLEQIDQLATNPPEDAQQRRRLYNAAQKLATAVEAPHDTVYRLIYSVIESPPYRRPNTSGGTR